jgi:hypothetical protein
MFKFHFGIHFFVFSRPFYIAFRGSFIIVFYRKEKNAPCGITKGLSPWLRLSVEIWATCIGRKEHDISWFVHCVLPEKKMPHVKACLHGKGKVLRCGQQV